MGRDDLVLRSTNATSKLADDDLDDIRTLPVSRRSAGLDRRGWRGCRIATGQDEPQAGSASRLIDRSRKLACCRWR